jgi:hypothetical protein
MSLPMLLRWALQRDRPPPPMVVAENTQRRLGLSPAHRRATLRHLAWGAAHLGFGATVGVAARAWPGRSDTRAFVLTYGTAVWAINYGVVLPLLRLYPFVTRDAALRALDNYVSHLVYAAAFARAGEPARRRIVRR